MRMTSSQGSLNTSYDGLDQEFVRSNSFNSKYIIRISHWDNSDLSGKILLFSGDSLEKSDCWVFSVLHYHYCQIHNTSKGIGCQNADNLLLSIAETNFFWYDFIRFHMPAGIVCTEKIS